MTSSQQPALPSDPATPSSRELGGGDGADYSWGTKAALLAIIAAGLGAAFLNTWLVTADGDELEHLHASWLWWQGVGPYTGFWENHQPFFWYLLRPIVMFYAHSKDLVATLLAGRMFSWIVTAATVAAFWQFAAAVGGRKAAWCGSALLASYLAATKAFVLVRPDQLSLLLLILGTSQAMLAAGLRSDRPGRKPLQGFLAGLLLGAGVCVLLKGVFWLLAVTVVLAAWAALQYARRRGRGPLAMIALLVLGEAAAAAALWIWVFLANDPAEFWRQNIGTNAHAAGSTLRHLTTLQSVFQALFAWPMVSAPLAAVGLGLLGADSRPGAGARLALMLTLALAGLALVFLGPPFAQYHISLAIVVCVLAGAGLAAALGTLPGRGQAVALLLLVALGAACAFAFVACNDKGLRSPLKTALRPLQRMLDRSRPGDTYLGVMNVNPVFLPDAEPKGSMPRTQDMGPQAMENLHAAIAAKLPRFIGDFNMGVWMPSGDVRTLEADDFVRQHYRPIDPAGVYWERLDPLDPNAGATRPAP